MLIGKGVNLILINKCQIVMVTGPPLSVYTLNRNNSGSRLL